MPSLEPQRPGRIPQPPWGAYTPPLPGRALHGLARLGMARGPVKRALRRAWRTAVGVGPVDIVHRGLRLRLHPFDNTIDAKILFGSRPRERVELGCLARLPRRGLFLDIGANCGYYTLMACTLGYERVIAVEPNPLMQERLRFNVAANGLEGRVTVLPCALGASEGRCTLSVPAGTDVDLGGASVLPDQERMGPTESRWTVEVPMRTLADVLAEARARGLDALKIDVEGAEDQVLCGFVRTAPSRLLPRLVILEHVNRARWREDVLDLLAARGYGPVARTRANTVLRLDATPAGAPG